MWVVFLTAGGGGECSQPWRHVSTGFIIPPPAGADTGSIISLFIPATKMTSVSEFKVQQHLWGQMCWRAILCLACFGFDWQSLGKCDWFQILDFGQSARNPNTSTAPANICFCPFFSFSFLGTTRLSPCSLCVCLSRQHVLCFILFCPVAYCVVIIRGLRYRRGLGYRLGTDTKTKVARGCWSLRDTWHLLCPSRDPALFAYDTEMSGQDLTLSFDIVHLVSFARCSSVEKNTTDGNKQKRTARDTFTPELEVSDRVTCPPSSVFWPGTREGSTEIITCIQTSNFRIISRNCGPLLRCCFSTVDEVQLSSIQSDFKGDFNEYFRVKGSQVKFKPQRHKENSSCGNSVLFGLTFEKYYFSHSCWGLDEEVNTSLCLVNS